MIDDDLPSFRPTEWTIGANVCISTPLDTAAPIPINSLGSATEWVFDVRLLAERVAQQEIHSKVEPFPRAAGCRCGGRPHLLLFLLDLHCGGQDVGLGALDIGSCVELWWRGGR